MFSSLIVLPSAMAAPPYSLNEAQIGATNVPGGVGSFIAAPLGGYLADVAARRYSSHPTGRVIINYLITLVALPIGTLLFAWSLNYTLPLAVPLLGEAVM